MLSPTVLAEGKELSSNPLRRVFNDLQITRFLVDVDWRSNESRRRSLPLGTDGATFQAAVCGGALCRLIEDGEAAGCGHGGGWGHAEAPAAGTAWLPLLSAGGEVLPFGELDLHVETLRELPAAVDHADRRAEWNAHRRHTVLAEKMRPSK
jgi:hypothetical protein